MFGDPIVIVEDDIQITKKRSHSMKRRWNRLSRFQKNILIVLISALAIVTFLITLQNRNNLNRINESSRFMKDRKHAESSTEKEFKVAEHISTNDIKINDINLVETVKPNDQIDNSENDNLNNEIEKPKVDTNIEENSISNNDEVYSFKFKGPTNERQEAVVNAFKHAWKAYKEFAWGHDNLKPLWMGYHDWFGLGLTIIDALDTIKIMNLEEEYDAARNWVDQSLTFDINKDVNLFEVTIRVLGGLLSIYHLTGDTMYLKKSVDLADRLMVCLVDSPSGIPFSDVNLATRKAKSPKWSPDSSTSEISTIQLEFRDLSRITNNPVYENESFKVSQKLHELPKTDGLVPIFVNVNTGTFRTFATISLGARGDSYYEYLLKQHLQMGKRTNDFLIKDYREAIDGVIKNLRKATPKEKLVYIGELINGKDFKPKMDHLTCYLPGTLLLGYMFADMDHSHFKLATELLETCFLTYMKTPTGLAAEITYFSVGTNNEESTSSDLYVKTNDAHNLLRPEFVESLYYFYALTGNKTYQDMGWTIFQNFEKYTRVTHGYTSIGSVKSPLNTRPKDFTESFFFGETLKYFYLLFSDDRNEIDLKKFLFNTEAHLIPVRES